MADLKTIADKARKLAIENDNTQQMARAAFQMDIEGAYYFASFGMELNGNIKIYANIPAEEMIYAMQKILSTLKQGKEIKLLS